VTPSETLNFSVSDNDRDEALLDTVFVCWWTLNQELTAEKWNGEEVFREVK
jgi:hypothetical protein